MAGVNEHFLLVTLLKHMGGKGRRRFSINEEIIAILLTRRNRRNKLIQTLMTIILSYSSPRTDVKRRVRRKIRNVGWWDLVWSTYDDKRFKETFRITRASFVYIIHRARPFLQKQSLIEEPIAPELRLAVYLYRLGTGDYMYTIAEMTGLGVSTVCTIVLEVFEIIVNEMWNSSVVILFPKIYPPC